MKKIVPAVAVAALLPCAGVVGRAFVLMKRRPFESVYEMRVAQSDFVALRDLPKRLVELTLESEDPEFYRHKGFNPKGIRDAVQINHSARKIATGGSTITQQLAKNLYFNFEHSYLRKATELVIALEAERKLGKDKILELYLNIIYYGNGVYGVGDAARFYFDREPKDLTVNQMFMLAILPVVPTRGNPIQHPEAFERFRNKRIALLSSPKHAVITQEEAEQIRSRHADCLDPDLRKADEFTDSYPQYITLTNERFGPFRNEGYRNPMQGEYDVVVIGAGVIGSATARELARFDVRVLVLEAGLDLACGATRANSGIVHAGYDPLPGTLKAKYNVAGAALFDQWQRELGFAFFRNGALVLAFNENDLEVLERLGQQAAANGVEGVSIVGADELRGMEPNVSPDAIAALNVPSSGICDPYGLTYGAAENAAANGVEFEFDAPVVGVSRDGDRFFVNVKDGRSYSTRAIVNCAGVHADEINNLVSERKIEIMPVKGEYLLYNNALAGTFRRTMFQVPSESGKGVLVSPVVFGNIFIGPNAEPVPKKDDLSTTEEGQRAVLERSKRTWPAVSTNQVIATYAGIRARDASGAGDFIVGEAPDVPGFFNAACIDSPGLASAPAIATDLARMVADRLGATENAEFNPVRVPAPLLVMMPDEAKEQLIAENPLYGVPVCKCCHVSEGELVDALHRALPVKSLDALKWRTGATMGPCHGGRCTARIMQIVQRELGAEAGDVQKRQQGSNMIFVDQDASSAIVQRCSELADELRSSLESRGLREVGSGSLGIAGTRPAGVYSALQAVELLSTTGRLPGRKAVVWGTHELALRATLALADAGVTIERVLEAAEALAGAPALLDELAVRGIPVQCRARVTAVAGADRLESATVVHDDVRESLTCDLLIASPCLVAE